MDIQQAKELLLRYRTGRCTESEKQQVEDWISYGVFPEYEISSDELEQELTAMENALPVYKAGKLRLQGAEAYGVKLRSRRLWLASAAAVAAIIAGVWFYAALSRHSLPSRVSRDLYANHIKPGRNTATLTLASGEVIYLDTNKNSVVVTDSVKAVTMLIASTPRGGQYQVTLPDGTKAWLNAASSIKFASNLAEMKKRMVFVSGEVYFEVAHNPSKPFIAETAGNENRPGQEVTVLGTHFNISSYADEGSVKTTLLEGSVRIAPLSSGANAKDPDSSKPGMANGKGMTNSIVLRPNQQAILATDKGIAVKTVNADEAIAWKNGVFIFDDEPLELIMQRVARWYNVEVSYSDGVDRSRTYGGSVSRYDDLSSLLEVLESTKNIHFKIEGRRILVMR